MRTVLDQPAADPRVATLAARLVDELRRIETAVPGASRSVRGMRRLEAWIATETQPAPNPTPEAPPPPPPPAQPTATPTPIPTPEPSPTPAATPEPTATPSATPEITEEPEAAPVDRPGHPPRARLRPRRRAAL